MSLIDATELLLNVIAQPVVDKSVVKRLIMQAPEVDAVPVVRCKECKHFDELHDNIGVCTYDRGRMVYYAVRGMISGDWYCADGEREEDDLPTSANHDGERREE